MHLCVCKSDINMTDFLLFWNSDIDVVDINGKSVLHYAAANGDSTMVVLLLKRNAKCALIDKFGKKPIDYALEQGNNGDNFVQIVTILRLTVLNKETRNNSNWRTSIIC